jgi:hypothetical protein
MRNIIITLILANIIFLVFTLWAPPQTGSRTEVSRARGMIPALQLLSEISTQGFTEVGASAQEPGNPGYAAQGDTACLSIEGFTNLEDATEFTVLTAALDLEVELRLTGDLLGPHFRVFLGPFPTREEASSALDALKQRTETEREQVDSYLITRGALENGIAFGVFARQAEAQELQARLDRLGLAAEIDEVPRTDGEVSVVISETEMTEFSEAIWTQILLDIPYLSRRQILC